MIQFNDSSFSNIFLGNDVINSVYLGNEMIWPDTPQELDWFTITSQSSQSGFVTVHKDDGLNTNLEYSYDGKTWETVVYNSKQYTLPNHGYIKFRGNNPNGLCTQDKKLDFYVSVEFSVGGSLMTLINKNINIETVPSEYCFLGLFYNTSTRCRYTHELKLPKYLTAYCFSSMLSNNTYLETIPDFSQCVFAPYSCNYMFYQCSSLTSITIEDTQLAENCFYNMFCSCGNLTTAILKPKQLIAYCYHYMFRSCSKLSSIDCHALTNINTFSTYHWLSGVADSGTFTYHCDDDVWSSGDSGIPSTWTKIKA